jgi:hypothetical protein
MFLFVFTYSTRSSIDPFSFCLKMLPNTVPHQRNLLLFLSRAPYTRNAYGIGIMMAARQPSTVAAQLTPKFSNICLEKSGKPAATAERRMIFAATADAALFQVAWRQSSILQMTFPREVSLTLTKANMHPPGS